MDLKQKIFGVLIGIIFALLIGVAIDTFYSSPDYSSFCENNIDNPRLVKPSTDCTDVYDANSLLEQQCYNQNMEPIYYTDEDGCRVFKECSNCREEYDTARASYSRIVFIITMIIGLAAVFVAAYRKEDFLSLGMIIGGILLIIYGNAIYFGDMHKWERLVSLLAEFIILVWLGYRRFRK